MKLKTKILTGAGGAAFLGMLFMALRPTKTILKNLKIRVDTLGNGNYGSGRTPPYKVHKGIDLVTTPGEKVYAPFSGTAVILNNVYPNSKAVFKGIKIFTKENLEVDVLYILPAITDNTFVKKGQLIGYSQDIRVAHDNRMLAHIHIEHKDLNSNQFIDPTNYYFPNELARTASKETLPIIENPSNT